MAVKSQTSYPPAGEAPPKRGRVEVAGVSEQRLKSELQRLVAQTDIATATVGQVLTQLELCLGLAHGALRESKHLRRLTCRVLQEEVSKKAQRSPDCERIVRALASCEAYPDCCRQMLVEGLPNALSRNGEGSLHPHQVRLLEMARDAITDAKAQATQKRRNLSEGRNSAVDVLQGIQKASDLAREAQVAASKVVQAWAEKLRNAEAKLVDAGETITELQRNRQEATKSRPALESALAEAVHVSTCSLQLLMSGSWKTTDVRDKALLALEKLLTEKFSAERSLAVAMPDALGCRPAGRSPFAKSVAAALSQAVSEIVVALQAKLQASLQAQDEKHMLEAMVARDAALDAAANDMITLADARESFEACSAVCEVQNAEQQQQASCVDNLGAEQALAGKVVEEFSAVLQEIERLMMCSCPKVATNGVAEECVAAHGDVAAGSSAGA